MALISNIENISIIGSGNVAEALGLAFTDIGVKINDVYSQNLDNAKNLGKLLSCSGTNNISDINKNSHLYLIAISDSHVQFIANQLTDFNGIIAHTSGSQPLSVLSSNKLNYGVFYPLQTFTKANKPDIKKVPICIEANNKSTFDKLYFLASQISNTVVDINSYQRLKLHLSAVIVNNFSNLLYSVAHDLLTEQNIDFSLLLPLINETASKLNTTKPAEAQTGPARRNDRSTIKTHNELLENYPELKEIYNMLTNHIIRKYHE